MPERMVSGEVLGKRFQLESPLGDGAASEVWRARRLQDDTAVAIKLSRVGGARRSGREVEALERLGHPAVVRFLEQGEHQGRPYVVLELVEGETLRKVLVRRAVEGRPFSPAEFLALIGPVAEALDEAHLLGITHRDLKPDNLILEPSGRLRILDFDIARLDDVQPTAATTRGRVVGTTFYLSPEQALGEAVDGRTDVFALSVLAFECLTLRRLWAWDPDGKPLSIAESPKVADSNHPVAVINRILSTRPPRARDQAPWLPQALDDFLALGLARDQALRPYPPKGWLAGLSLALAGAPEAEPVPLRPGFDPGARLEEPSTQPPSDPEDLAATVSTGPPPTPSDWDRSGSARTVAAPPPGPRVAARIEPVSVESGEAGAATATVVGPTRSGLRIVGAVLLALGLVALGWWQLQRQGPPPVPSVPVRLQNPD